MKGNQNAWGLCFDFGVEQFVPSDRLIKAISPNASAGSSSSVSNSSSASSRSTEAVSLGSEYLEAATATSSPPEAGSAFRKRQNEVQRPNWRREAAA